MPCTPRKLRFFAFVGLIIFSAVHLFAGDNLSFERTRFHMILDTVSSDVEKNFYDPGLHGLDWKALKQETSRRVDNAKSVSDMVTAITVLVNKLGDSHTIFVPPQRVDRLEFGFEAKAFGDHIFVYKLKQDGAAQAAGLQPGDEIITVNGYNAVRESFDLMMLYFRALRPTPALDLVIQRGHEAPRSLRVQAKIMEGRFNWTVVDEVWRFLQEEETAEEKFHVATSADGIGYLEMKSFMVSDGFLSVLLGKIKNARATIIDLRGDLGGREDILVELSGHFQSEPGSMADVVMRKKTEQLRIKPRNPNIAGPIFILVDSQSASAAEMFARHFQLNKKAVIIGDRTSGRVNGARMFWERVGTDTIVPFGVEIAMQRVVFPGGEELEKHGVTPDVACIPTADDLTKKNDPCLGLAEQMARKALGLSDPGAKVADNSKAK